MTKEPNVNKTTATPSPKQIPSCPCYLHDIKRFVYGVDY